MGEQLFDWLLLIIRWVHITVAVTWIGTSIFFMWLDRSFVKNSDSKRDGHIGELWMVHGGGFYHVEKLQMGPTKVPKELHWFKWESYWTWMSGFALLALIFYTGNGTFLLDDAISDITYGKAVLLSLFSVFGSWFFYDFVWERKSIRDNAIIGHVLTLAWFFVMTYILCTTISGRAAYIHIGGMLGTWMTANVFMRIIPRQLKMVEASRNGEPVNQDWGKNAKNRSTHNTYFTLPVIFIMLSNHFPATYGHDLNWLVLLLISAAGAAIREYFVVRLSKPARAHLMAAIGVLLIMGVALWTSKGEAIDDHSHDEHHAPIPTPTATPVVENAKAKTVTPTISPTQPSEVVQKGVFTLSGIIKWNGAVPKGKKLRLPRACAKQFKGDVFSNEIIVNQDRLENVFIRVKNGHEGLKIPPVPKTEYEIDQKGCIYWPRVNAVRAGQKVTFINSDPIFHNVKSITKKNKKFNSAMPRKDQRLTKVFKNPEFYIQTKCSVHPWMNAYIAVLDHPYYAVSSSNGEFNITGLANGDYTLELWHESFGAIEQKVTINGNTKFEYSYGVKK